MIPMQNDTLNALKGSKSELLELWIQKQAADNSFDSFSHNQEKDESEDFLNAFLEALNASSIDDVNAREFDKVHEILIGISASRAKRGFSPRENALYLFSFKEALFEVLSKNGTDTQSQYNNNLKLSKILDNMTILTFESFVKGREEVIARQTDEISEISTPVIRVWDEIVALPIIGTLDSARTQVVMENLLQQIVETGSSIAILDISGVPAVDSLVAQHLIKTVSATRLMGAECIISGIRPEIAQTVVHLGIDLSNIITKATLASALQTAFSMLKLEVHKKRTIV